MAWAHLLNAHQLRLSHLQPRTVSTPVDICKKVTDHLPMQKLAKMLPRRSSVLISPVISPR